MCTAPTNDTDRANDINNFFDCFNIILRFIEKVI